MGVNNLWKALGSAVQTLEGHNAGQHAEIVDAVENKVVAVDLSAWLMQAQSQPALLEHYDSPYARAAKVVFDRTIHWLRYGCLPVFVIEGQTPAAKLEKLRQRCIAQYGPTARSYDVGNRAGGQFDRLGQAMKRLLDAFGVPCVQAAGEGEAMCAALNLCGWAHACHTLDVDVLLFGALTVYRQMHLQTDDPRKSSLVRCCRADVQRLLGISRGGEAALQCIAQLAGGDYNTTGAEQVGEGMAMDAVRQLLQGCEDDEAVLQKLEAALAAGPDPELDALTK
ncbi:PIN domain-like protein [Scenedesmus sp. NREL 46B-D3]|nr:PIN domain-like protein [Scenedesmus sp. NREL 46B-D3]